MAGKNAQPKTEAESRLTLFLDFDELVFAPSSPGATKLSHLHHTFLTGAWGNTLTDSKGTAKSWQLAAEKLLAVSPAEGLTSYA